MKDKRCTTLWSVEPAGGCAVNDLNSRSAEGQCPPLQSTNTARHHGWTSRRRRQLPSPRWGLSTATWVPVLSTLCRRSRKPSTAACPHRGAGIAFADLLAADHHHFDQMLAVRDARRQPRRGGILLVAKRPLGPRSAKGPKYEELALSICRPVYPDSRDSLAGWHGHRAAGLRSGPHSNELRKRGLTVSPAGVRCVGCATIWRR